MADKKHTYVFGMYKMPWADNNPGVPALVICRSKNKDTRLGYNDILITLDGSTLFFRDTSFEETGRTPEHMSILKMLPYNLEYHKNTYHNTHDTLSIDEAESLFL